MQRNALILGIILLFIGSIVSPITFGVIVDNSKITLAMSDYDYASIPYSSDSTVSETVVFSEYLNPQPTVVLDNGLMDSPWPMKCHDNRHTSLSPYDTVNNSGIEKWRLYTDIGLDGGISIGQGGMIYYGDWGHDLVSVYPNGEVKWKYSTGNIIWSTPAIAEDGTVYIGSYDAKLHAVYPNGTGKWKTGLGGSITSSPAIANDGTIYVGTMGDTGRMCAVYPNGTIKWRFDTGYHITSDPAIGDDGAIYFGSGDTYIYCIYPNGTLKWKYKTGGLVKGHASIASDGTIYMGSWDGYLYAFYPDNGTVKWKTVIDQGFESNPSIGPDGTIYVARKHLWAVNPDGTKKWSFSFLEDDEKVAQSSAAISHDGIIYIGTNIGSNKGGEIYAVNPNGTFRWRKEIGGLWVDSTPAIAEDGTIYIGSSGGDEIGFNGYLHAFNDVESNSAPNPPVITGSAQAQPRRILKFYFMTEDDDKNPISLFIEWGDGETTGWTQEFASGENAGFKKTYTFWGTYSIRAKAQDIFGEESDWGYFEIQIPKAYNYPGWQWLCERFPLLAQLLNRLGGLE
jgi:outer membrane protein assembly factor BamB